MLECSLKMMVDSLLKPACKGLKFKRLSYQNETLDFYFIRWTVYNQTLFVGFLGEMSNNKYYAKVLEASVICLSSHYDLSRKRIKF